jgi:hypothetical protein
MNQSESRYVFSDNYLYRGAENKLFLFHQGGVGIISDRPVLG